MKDLSTNMSTENQKVIYILTVFKDPDDHKKPQRTWGWFSDLQDAQNAVLTNATDMFECKYYEWAVIEEFPEGLLTMAIREWWYKADYNDPTISVPSHIYPVEKPACLEGVVNFGLG